MEMRYHLRQQEMNLGYSIATDYYGQTLTIGAPYQTINSITKAGSAYLFSRSVQNIEVQTKSLYLFKFLKYFN